jgi:hypothetical protein
VSLLVDLQIGDPAFTIANWLELQRSAKQAEQIAWRTGLRKAHFPE